MTTLVVCAAAPVAPASTTKSSAPSAPIRDLFIIPLPQSRSVAMLNQVRPSANIGDFNIHVVS
jgi:hypothetical protein